jgi:uncharacterized membrane protein (DUF485 family)
MFVNNTTFIIFFQELNNLITVSFILFYFEFIFMEGYEEVGTRVKCAAIKKNSNIKKES